MTQIRLYDYQLDMKRRIEAAFGSHQSVMVQMPTGTGKTCLLASVVYGWMAGNDGDVWIVAHRRELVEQIRETVGRLAVGVDMSGVATFPVVRAVGRGRGRPLSQLTIGCYSLTIGRT